MCHLDAVAVSKLSTDQTLVGPTKKHASSCCCGTARLIWGVDAVAAVAYKHEELHKQHLYGVSQLQKHC
jgi:hypothetical protein